MIDAVMEGLNDLSYNLAPIIRMVGLPKLHFWKRRAGHSSSQQHINPDYDKAGRSKDRILALAPFKFTYCTVKPLTSYDLCLPLQEAEKRGEAKASFHAAHVDPASKAQSNGGAHFAYIANLVEAYGDGFAVGSKPSIAGEAPSSSNYFWHGRNTR